MKTLALNNIVQVFNLDLLPVSDLSGFSQNNDPAVLIDLVAEKISNDRARDIALSLPDSYKAIFLRKDVAFIKDGLKRSLSEHLNPALLDPLLNELYLAIDLFGAITYDEKPLVSLRVVTSEYVEKEHPSVSKFYHRDAAALTLTKCFYGEGAIYLREQNTNRTYFDENSIALNDADAAIDDADCQVVPQSNWILLKGEMYKGIDARNQAVVDIVLGEGAKFKDFAKGIGLIHKGGRFIDTERRLVFTISTYKTEF
ncbi:hypothetical protein J3D54_005449 [Pseudomonas sp. GGS8]|uniref:DUF1826 domain-containing protein n=1 Tax=Pseudomonas sp. GGS8 TaxID=2817892 RepID=UPI0020A02430|nr:DUF1826 domain-containing protein [Pseudomonas sp. GGS8]MCP1446317.1 hypothetical protein [Pseudomonas sp. GGS8]